MAKSLGYENVNAYAEALGMSTEDLYDTIEKNSRAAVNRQEHVFGRLNKVLGTSANEIDNFGESIKLSSA
jgi:hypothetical protein